MSNLTLFPPGTECFIIARNTSDFVDCSNVLVTPAMVDYLNLTSSMDTYKQAYCLNPQPGDSCPFGFCPQPDIAGPLVRISTYITTLCLSIIMFYSPGEVRDAFYSSILTVYSILITCCISIFQRSLSRFHALLAATIVGSPLTFYMGIYAVRSMFGHRHRLDAIMGPGKLAGRLMVIGTVLIWAAFIIYTLLPSNLAYFAQVSCEPWNTLVKLLFFLPIILFAAAVVVAPVWAVAAVAPILAVALSWGGIIIMRRRTIWPHPTTKWWQFWTVWALVRDDYPFIYFMSAVIVPYIYWVVTCEVGLLDSPEDNKFTLSFGQVLAMFVTLPPMIGVAKLLPGAWGWFTDLTWTRALTGRPLRRRPSGLPSPLTAAMGSKTHSQAYSEDAVTLHSHAMSYSDAWEAKRGAGTEYAYGGTLVTPPGPPGLVADARGRYAKVNVDLGYGGLQGFERRGSY